MSTSHDLQIKPSIDVDFVFGPGKTPRPADDVNLYRFADILEIDPNGDFDRAVADAGKRWDAK